MGKSKGKKVITSVDDFLNEIDLLKRSNKNIKFFYRGEGKFYKNSHLLPGIFRNGKDCANKKESEILQKTLDATREKVKNKNYIEKLVFAQHHGCPTRLLDITENPLVALFFACEDLSKKKAQGKVYIFKEDLEEKQFLKKPDIDTEEKILCVLPYLKPEDRELVIEWITNNTLKRVGKLSSNVLEKVNDYFETNINELQEKREFLKKCHILIPEKDSDLRVPAQSSAFILLGIASPKNYAFRIRNELLLHTLDIGNKKTKEKIIAELDSRKKINRQTLFCDSDSTARYIKDKYFHC